MGTVADPVVERVEKHSGSGRAHRPVSADSAPPTNAGADSESPRTDTTADGGLSTRPIPTEIAERLSTWHKRWLISVCMHYTFGILGVGASALAAASYYQEIFAVVAAVSIAIIGFVQPERRYLKFVRAWRHLDGATLRYRYGRADINELLDAVRDGEAILTEVELETRKPDTANRGDTADPQ